MIAGLLYQGDLKQPITGSLRMRVSRTKVRRRCAVQSEGDFQPDAVIMTLCWKHTALPRFDGSAKVFDIWAQERLF